MEWCFDTFPRQGTLPVPNEVQLTKKTFSNTYAKKGWWSTISWSLWRRALTPRGTCSRGAQETSRSMASIGTNEMVSEWRLPKGTQNECSQGTPTICVLSNLWCTRKSFGHSTAPRSPFNHKRKGDCDPREAGFCFPTSRVCFFPSATCRCS